MDAGLGLGACDGRAVCPAQKPGAEAGWESAQETSGHQPACPPLNAAQTHTFPGHKSHTIGSSADVHGCCRGSSEAFVVLFFEL